MKLSVREIAIAGVLSAVAVLLAVTQLGFIPFFAGISITVMHVPVIIGAIVAGPAVGTFIGLIFGVSSLILAAVAPKGPGDLFFTDPWVAVVPRLFIGLAAWGVYRLVGRMGKKWSLGMGGAMLAAIVVSVSVAVGTSEMKLAWLAGLALGILGFGLLGLLLFRAQKAHPEELALSLAAVMGTLTNSVLVLGALVLRGYIPGGVALTVGAANGPAEMAAATVITVAVIAAWKQLALKPARSSV